MTDVLVVGAGPTGLVLAADLASCGVAVRLVDRASAPHPGSRAIAVQARTLESLATLGATEALLRHGRRLTRLTLCGRGAGAALPLFDQGVEDTPYPFVLLISQAHTMTVLEEVVAERGVVIERGVEVVGLDQSADDVAVALRGPDGRLARARARVVVGCDGARSAVRFHAGIPFEGGTYGETFVLGDVAVDPPLDPGCAHAFTTSDGALLMLPLGDPAPWRVVGPLFAAAQGDESPATLADLQAVVAAATHRPIRVHDAAWLSRFRLEKRLAARFRDRRVLLAGDAAHVHSPLGGQGMNTGIQDARNLAWKLALHLRAGAPSSLIDSYEAERRPVAASVLRMTDRLYRVALTRGLAAKLARGGGGILALRAAARSPRLRRRLSRRLGELDVGYRGSPIVAGAAPRRRVPRPGDRLPDAPVRGPAGERSLHEALAGPSLVILLCEEAAGDLLGALPVPGRGILPILRLADHAGPGIVHDVHGLARSRLGLVSGGVILVRPDGYIGYRSEAPDLPGLRRHLDLILGGAAGAAPATT